MKALGFLGKGSMDYGDVSSIDRGEVDATKLVLPN
jgi:hypothetical protein